LRLSGNGLHNRALILVAPFGVEPNFFGDVIGSRRVYDAALGEMQRFRGQVYVSEGNLSSADLSPDGRHVQAADSKSWHLLTLDEQGSVGACGRILVHRSNASFRELLVSHCALARCEGWGYLLQRAVEEQIQSTRQQGMQFAEIGGWAVDRSLRCTTEALRLLMAGYALGQLLGGVIGITTANTGHHSSSILRRIGGVPLTTGNIPFPKFYEPQYRAEIEILCLDSFRMNPHFQQYMRECVTALETATVISSVPARRPIRRDFVHDVYLRTLIPYALDGISGGLEQEHSRRL
jgi:hypothetical protein